MLLSKFVAAHREDSNTQLLRRLRYPALVEEGGLQPRESRQVHFLREGSNSVGRSGQRDLVLESTGVSASHAEFRSVGDGWELVDLDSTNGTFVDGHRLTPGAPVRVPPQSVVEFASARFAFLSPTSFLETVRRAQVSSGQYRRCLIPTSAVPKLLDAVSEDTLPIKVGPARTERGELTDFQVLDLLRRLEANQHSGRLGIVGADGRRGWISFRVGLPWDARAFDGRRGVQAVLGLLEIDAGEFYVQEAHIPVGPRKISLGLSDILLSAERRRSKAAAALSEAQLRATFETAFHGLVVCGATGHVLFANRRCEEMFGRTTEELSGQHVDQILSDCAGLFTPQNTGQVQETQGRRRSGARFPLELSVSQFEIDGTATWTLALHDLTDRKETERALREANAALEHSQKMEALGRLAAGITHDFRNLLTAILGYSELLVATLEPDQSTRRWAEAIKKAANQGSTLTQQLLSVARPEEAVAPTATDLDDVLGELGLLVKTVLGDRIELCLPAGPGVGSVLIDRSQLERALMNLVVNARDAIAGEGRIEISAARVRLDETRPAALSQLARGTYVCLAVADTGAGMSPETAGKVFEPFFTTKGRSNGTGLGLSVVYGVIKQSGGLITVESELGHGTTFTAYLRTSTQDPPSG